MLRFSFFINNGNIFVKNRIAGGGYVVCLINAKWILKDITYDFTFASKRIVYTLRQLCTLVKCAKSRYRVLLMPSISELSPPPPLLPSPKHVRTLRKRREEMHFTEI